MRHQPGGGPRHGDGRQDRALHRGAPQAPGDRRAAPETQGSAGTGEEEKAGRQEEVRQEEKEEVIAER
ncbi:hypothetical protein AERO8C_50211 [Aeromonas veronii]|uniref:Uncharacterized protein n=1 Tax=Aeromonas veronii TaxID=654 RepID=A0A653L6Z4_AERVE|nr:hypothetical protein AERO8C_50211 [Aeromonas veronii]